MLHRSKKTKKKKKPSKQNRISRLKKNTHDLWSKAIRARDKYCIFCGTTNLLQAHHWIVHSKGSIATRYLLSNGVTLCRNHHLYGVHQKGDAVYLDKIKDYMINRFVTPEGYEKIKFLGSKTSKKTEEEIKEIGKELAQAYEGFISQEMPA